MIDLSRHFVGLRVEVVPDDNAQADPRIPPDVLEALKPDSFLTNGTMIYIRASLWDSVKHHFPGRRCPRN